MKFLMMRSNIHEAKPGRYNKNPLLDYSPMTSEKDLKHVLLNSPEGSRYIIYTEWKKADQFAEKAHVFIAEKYNSQVFYLDPQISNENAGNYFSESIDGRYMYYRVDDKKMTTDKSLLKQVFVEDKDE